jgi:hypothetical protein
MPSGRFQGVTGSHQIVLREHPALEDLRFVEGAVNAVDGFPPFIVNSPE